ncbi:hypothetical protein HNQ07_004362 [Deinococcus metalli]|uniref:Uncharacterized protein n=1 Tax=Deinococcus metalli TaxID=1141878 RepID=A0A7W8KJ42_9DEIO|nr:hypothetical protein [Deinococcus metalli]MBB5378855.1 hypothetical protein [Deinococcus metalli]GHF62198.1 hypothetical protein GCM10017781_42850 [Deinococcus metalli]
MRHAHLALTAATLALTLAACGHSTTPSPSASADFVTLSLRAPFAPVTSQGLPGADGRSPVDHLKVKVYDAQQKAVTFDGQNVYQQGGPQAFLTLDAAHPSATALLPKGTYSFENVGTAGAGGTFLAYGRNDDQDLSADSPSVTLDLHALIDPDTLALNTYLPVKYAFTQDVLDLRLQARTPVAGEASLPVPTNDYEVTYAASLAEVLGSSPLGARVKVLGQTGAATIDTTATVSGWMADGAETASWRSVPVTAHVALGSSSIGADVGAPTASVDVPAGATAGLAGVLTGAASDAETGIAAVRVFDGSTLIGSTDSADGVSAVTFALDGELSTSDHWTLSWTPSTAGPHDLTVVVEDMRGNETWKQQTVTVGQFD